MTRKDYTHIAIIRDVSGSMASIKADSEGGLNTLIDEQKKQPGKCTVSLFDFYEHQGINVIQVLNGVDIQSVGPLTLTPRGGTPMRDGIAHGIIMTGEFLKGLQESDRPALVSVVIVTDGGDNTYQQDYSYEQVAEMVKHQTEQYQWEFTYLGANQDAVLTAQRFAIPAGRAATYNNSNSQGAYKNFSGKMSSMRSMVSSGMAVSEASLSNSYSAQDRSDLAGNGLDLNNVGNAVTGLGLSIAGNLPAVMPPVNSSNSVTQTSKSSP